MTHLLTLEGQLRLVGAALIVMGAFHAVLPRLIGWPSDLAGTTLLTRQVSYAHLFFIALTCVLLGLLPLLLAPDLLAGGRLGTVLLAAQTLLLGPALDLSSSRCSHRSCGAATGCGPPPTSPCRCCGPG
ncbi:hypothetical protein [Kitasatospora cineracea]|uniref:hypothetical protein n=1 Tax=Kitasatospora cineracea TaxID=88074 RepID=UPI001ABFABDD|nr:hypothetical protein [Kitasatospora cineracea]